MEHKILVVDDELMVRNVIQRMLQREDYQVKSVDTGREAIREFQKYQPSLVILDLHLDDMDGLTVMSELKQISPDTLIILITAYADVETAVKAMREGAYDFIQKPFMVEELVLIIRKAMETIQLKHEVKLLRQLHLDLNDISPRLGNSPKMKRLLKRIEEIAITEMPVLLTGEIGTEKELIARYIHHLSNRFSKPLIKIDCEKMAPQFEEAIFEFNTEQDEISLKAEWYEKLNKSTLLLDDIDRTSLNFQDTLIQYLKCGEPTFIRKNKSIFRLLATSSTPLADSVNSGKFRNSLFQFLKSGEIKIPALREHSEDILPIAHYFLERANARFKKNTIGFTPKAKEILVSLAFKENTRELRQLIDRLIFLFNKDYIDAEDLIQTGLCESQFCFQLPVHLNRQQQNEKVMPALIHKVISKTMEIANGDLKKASQLLGLNEMHLNAFLTHRE